MRPQFDSWVWKIHWRRDRLPTPVFLGFPSGSAGKESGYNAGDLGSTPGLERSTGEENSYPLQYSGLENLPANTGDVGLIPWSGGSPAKGNGNPLQDSCQGNTMHRGAWGGYSPQGHRGLDTTWQLNSSMVDYQFILHHEGWRSKYLQKQIKKKTIQMN